jgi:hypothetical protein
MSSITATNFVGELTGNASTATTLSTSRNIFGQSFNGSADISGIIAPTFGGTGVNNGDKTITLGGTFKTIGNYTTELTVTGNTSITLPISGTISTIAGTETLTNKTLISPYLDGIPTAPTAEIGTKNTQVATTEFVFNSIASISNVTGEINTNLDTKESLLNKSINIITDASSDVKYPSVKAVKTYVDGAITNSATPDATTESKGKLKLAGDLGGTADLPSVLKVGGSTAANLNTAEILANAATDLNTIGTIVKRDNAGNFTAGVITASLAGNSSTTTKLANSVTVYGNSFDGSANLTGVIATQYGGTGTNTSTGTGSVVLSNSPELTGIPVAPTASAGNNTTQIATTAFVANATSSIFSNTTQLLAAKQDVFNEFTDESNATASQTSFTLTNTPSAKSVVKMYINGIRISKNAFSVTGKTLSYVANNNGSYALQAGDRIQIDYFFIP